jgi:hypothetical protein
MMKVSNNKKETKMKVINNKTETKKNLDNIIKINKDIIMIKTEKKSLPPPAH